MLEVYLERLVWTMTNKRKKRDYYNLEPKHYEENRIISFICSLYIAVNPTLFTFMYPVPMIKYQLVMLILLWLNALSILLDEREKKTSSAICGIVMFLLTTTVLAVVLVKKNTLSILWAILIVSGLEVLSGGLFVIWYEKKGYKYLRKWFGR